MEINGSLSFEGIKTNHENKIFVTVYIKPTFSDVFENFWSFIPDTYRRWLVKTLLHISFRLSYNYTNFPQEITQLTFTCSKPTIETL